MSENGEKYVAWLRYDTRKDDANQMVIRLCDSDAPGAFRVYRHSLACPCCGELTDTLVPFTEGGAVAETCQACAIDKLRAENAELRAACIKATQIYTTNDWYNDALWSPILRAALKTPQAAGG